MNFEEPQYYHLITSYSESDRSTYGNIRKNRPDISKVQIALNEFTDKCLFKNNFPNPGYVKALNFKVE